MAQDQSTGSSWSSPCWRPRRRGWSHSRRVACLWPFGPTG